MQKRPQTSVLPPGEWQWPPPPTGYGHGIPAADWTGADGLQPLAKKDLSPPTESVMLRRFCIYVNLPVEVSPVPRGHR